MPFLRQDRVGGLEVVDTWDDRAFGADAAVVSGYTTIDALAVNVGGHFRALPKDNVVRARGALLGAERLVALPILRVPFGRQLRVGEGKVIIGVPYPHSIAVRTRLACDAFGLGAPERCIWRWDQIAEKKIMSPEN
jgi:hypothetical protein